MSNSTNSASFVPQRPWSQRRCTLHVKGKIENVKCTWLLDTGSDVTCVSSRLPGIEKWNLTPPQSVPAAANGSPLRCLGEIVTNIEIGHVSKQNVRLLVIQNLNVPAILGMDTLAKFGSFGIDWARQTLTLGDAKLIVEKRSHGSVLSPVVVSLISDHVIPPRSQCFVHAGTIDYGPCDKDALFSPFMDKMAQLNVLFGASVVAAGPQNRIPVSVMNNSDLPVKLFAGTRIGEISPVRVEEQGPDVSTISATPQPPPTAPTKAPVAVDLDSCEVTASEKQELKSLLEDYRDVFANDDSEVGRTHRAQFHVHTKTHVPVAIKLRRTPFALRSEVDSQIKNMEERGIIEPSTSPYSAPILLVPKADGSYRFCADFRALNDATITEIFPLPSVRECLDSLHGSNLFTTLDLYSGYWQIPIAKGHRHKTAFSTESGHWQFCVMPFGVKNAPAVFARLMADIMNGLQWNGIAVYLDDIIIGGRNFREHFNLLKEVLERLRAAGLTVKSSKVSLCQKKLIFLGHQISARGIEPDPTKLSAIRDWPRPRNTKELRAFLGLCNYYSDFIPNLQQRAHVLNLLTGKSKFLWSIEKEAAFHDLKFALTSSDVLLHFPDISRPFELSTDASDTGIGCILSQRDDSGRDQPVLFASKALTNNELNWHTRDKEVYAFVFALRKFRPYLLGRRFTWHTDHKGLQWLRNTRDPRGRYARWLEESEEFDFVIKHRPGATNPHADALSRIPVVNSLAHDGLFSLAEFRVYQKSDPVLGIVISQLQSGAKNFLDTNPTVRQWSTKRDFLYLGKDDGLLYIRYKIGKHLVNQLVVPDTLIPFVLRLKHDNAGHMAAEKTTNLIRREYFWLNMVRDVTSYCQSCVPCARARPPPRHPFAGLTLSSQPQEPWQEIAMDIKGPFGRKPTKQGNRYVLVVVDLLTRAAEMIPIPDKSAKTVANAVVCEVFCRRGLPESILTDRGCEFDNQALSIIAQELGIDKKRISALHPQANGNVERLNRTIGEMLRKSTNESGDDWDLEIPFLRFNYMNHEHNTTGYSPFYLSHGYVPRTPRLVLAPSPKSRPSTAHQWASTLASRFKAAHPDAVNRDSQEKQRRVAQSTEDPTPLHVGDSVMMHVPPRPGLPSKLQNRWQGPFIVVKCLQGNTYRIKHANNFRKRLLRHRDQLRVLRTRPERLRPTQGENSSGHIVTVPPVPAMVSQPTLSSNDTSSHPQTSSAQEQPTAAPLSPSTDVTPTTPAVHKDNPPRNPETRVEESDVGQPSSDNPKPCSVPSLEFRRGTRPRRPPDRYGEWDLSPSENSDIDIYFVH